MFNSGFRGRRAPDNSGAISPQIKFVETKYPVPAITGWSISGSDDTALNPAGGQTVLVNGTGFAAGCAATLNGATISPVTLVSPTQISFTAPANSGGSYTLIVYNSGGGAAILVPGLTYSSVPTWTTAAGSIGSFYETTAVSTAVVATSDSALTYALSSGSLPVGSTLYANGVITGTAPVDSGSTTYTFAVTATDAELQDTTRTFTMTINVDVVTWVTPSSGATISLDGSAYSQALSATDAAGYAVSYTANTLPTGLTLSAGTISGTPTVEGNTSSLLTATAATTNRSATNTVTWVVSLSDTYFKYVTLGLSANASIQTSSFVADNSTNNAQLTVVGDTRAQTLNPYQVGYYSTYHSANGVYLTGSNSLFNISSGTMSWCFEGWIYPVSNAHFFAIGSGGAYGNSFYISWGSGTTNKFTFGQGNGSSNPVTITSTNTYTANRWYHVAVTKDASGVIRLFVNGTQDGTQTYTSAVSSGTTFVINGVYDNNGLGNAGGSFYASNYRFVINQPVYTANFTPSTVPLLNIPGTILLTCQSNRFVDNSALNLAITLGSTPQINSANPFTTVYQASTQYYSGSFNGSSDNLTVASSPTLTLSNGAFTVEAWIYLSGTQTTSFGYQVLGTYPAGATPNGYALVVNRSSATAFGIGWANGTPTAYQLYYGSGGTYLNTNTWYHIAVVRTSTAANGLKIYLNGVSVATGTDATNDAVLQTLYIGSQGAGQYFPGYISNARIVKGLAVYTGNFVPPTAPLSTTQSAGTNIAAITQPSYSVYFSGSGQYLSVPAGTAFNLSTSDFCIEMWVYPIAQSLYGALLTLDAVDYPLMIQWASAGSANIRFYAGSASAWFSGMPLTFGTTVLNTWQHLCVTRTSGVFRVFMNGVLGATLSDATAIGDSSGNIYIGSNGTSGYASQAYISNLRFIKGSVPTGYQTSSTTVGATIFTPSTSPLTTTSQGATAANVSLLTCQSTTIIDNSLNLWSITNTGTATVASPNPFATGTVALLTTQSSTFVDNSYNNFTVTAATTTVKPLAQSPFTPLYYSNYFNGSTDYLSIATNAAFNFGTSDFTVEAWIYGPAQFAYTGICGGASTPSGWTFRINASGTLSLTNGSTSYSSSSNVSTNTWTHVTTSRSGTTLRFFINGVAAGSSTSSDSIDISGGGFQVGRGFTVDTTNAYFTGYISNLRVTKGQALYTATFTPATSPLTTTSQGATAANVSLLTCQSLYFIDTSTNSFAITTAGSPKIAGIAPFTQPGGYSATAVTTWGSGYFDGTGDYLTVPYSINWSTYGSFTLELWVYFSTIAANNMTFASTGSTGYTNFYMYGSSGTYPGAIAVGIQGTNEIRSANSILAANAWYHVAYTYDGTTTKIYVNGAQVASAATAVYSNNSANLVIGNGLTNNYLSGYITDVRLVKGTVLYSSAFVPQFTTPLTAVTNTQLLTLQTRGAHNNSDFVDQSGFNNVVTRNGNATNGTFDPYGNNWSVALTSGADLGLYLGAQTAFSFGTGDFNIELWVMLASTGANQVILDFRPVAGNGAYPCVYFNSSNNKITYYVNSADTIVANSAITYNTWNHVAISRSSSVTRMFINGVVQTSTYSDTTNYTVGANRPYTGNGYGSSNQMTGGYISNLRIVKGQALYTTTFTPSTAPLTVTSQGATAGNVSLLTAQSNRYIDNSPNNFTVNTTGTLSVQKFSPFATVTVPTYYSTYFDGNGDYLNTPSNAAFAFGTGDYTAECWIYLSVLGTYRRIWWFSDDNDNTNVNASNQIQFGGASQTAITGSTLSANTWYHVAYVRSSGSGKLYLNGAQVGSTTANSYNSSTRSFYIGATNTGADPWSGYISNLRVTKGQALYTTTFTPSTSPLTTTSQSATASNVSLLTCQSNTFIDNSLNYLAITAAGDAKPLAVSPFSPTASSPVSYTPTTFGGSMYFDGSSDYLTVTNSIFTTTGDFTVECWAYVLSAQSGNYGGLFSTRDSSNSAGISINLLNTGYLDFGAYPGGGYTSTLTPLNQWFHVAMTRSGSGSNNVKCFLNGVQVGTISGTATTSTNSGLAIIGRYYVNGINQYFLSGYISDLRYTVGTALYTANFYPGATPATPTYTIGTATYSSNLLLSGATGGVIDYSRTVDLETVADAKVTPFSPYNTTYYSNLFDGGTSYFTGTTAVAFPIGTETFTVEMWLNKSNAWNTGNQVLLISSTASSFQLWVDASVPAIKVSFNGGATPLSYSTSGLVLGTWYHLAVVRSDSSFTMYVNGVSVATGTNSGSFATPSSIIIGNFTSGTTSGWNGYVSNLRIVRGTAVYTGNFTPSTTPLTAVSGTSLLTCQSNKFVDNSTNALTLTPSGTPKVQTQNPFVLNTGISYYFDGTGDYLSIPTSKQIELGSADWTFETWVFPVGVSSQQSILYLNANSSGYAAFNLQIQSGALNLWMSSTGSAWSLQQNTIGTITAGVWTYIAVTKSSTTMKVYINGTQAGTNYAVAQSLMTTYTLNQIGVYNTSSYLLNGNLSDLRLTQGYVRYSGNFTPPTTPYKTN